jgi:uncharacterized protein (DUF924 family)
VAAAAEKGGEILTTPKEVLSYWFSPGYDYEDTAAFRRRMAWWFGGGPGVDREIADRFGPVLEQARRGDVDNWARTPRGRLALIIVLDQFSRNIYRGTPLAYAQDPSAQSLALDGLDAGLHRDLTFVERIFFVLPLGHSEDLVMQERGVGCTEELASLWPSHMSAEYEFGLGQARGHRDTIARFGRFPHRNVVLGRTCAPDEMEYLDKDPVPLPRRASVSAVSTSTGSDWPTEKSPSTGASGTTWDR